MHFKKGSIRKIAVQNFVTYTYVEVFPGPNLNMLIGANGTGKSTIVAAIILGLGGSPKTIGRGSKISEYVKHNCEQAHIFIDLQAEVEDETISITRTFNKNEKSSWKLNGKDVLYKDIDKFIKSYNIQVDNLCQFLPQDRVADFAKMNKQQLLRQTQLAVCRNDLIEKQNALIEKRERHKILTASLEKNNQKLRELQDANIRLEGKIQNVNKRKKYLNHVEHLERKLAWLRYDSLRDKFEEIKTDRNKASQILEKHRNACKPIENAIKKARTVINQLQDKALATARSVREAENFTNTKIEHFNVLKYNLTKVVDDMNAKLQQINDQEADIKKTSQQIAKLTKDKDNLVSSLEDEGAVDEKLRNLNQNVKKISTQINGFVDDRNELENKKRQIMYELRAHENELNRLENIKEQRMQWLYRVDRDVYNTVKWLRSNKQMFKGEVFEPMMLELNVLNQNHAIFVENTIPIRDKLAFTCTSKEDMNLLIRTVRDQQNLNINVVHSGTEGPSLSSYKPRIPIEELKPLGFFAFVKDLVVGPEPVMKYLCKNYQIHNIPVGSHVTNSKYDAVPRQITNFFSDTYHFSTTFSKYTGEKSTRQSEIKSDGSLSISVDTDRIETVRQQLANAESVRIRYASEQEELEGQINKLNETKESYRNDIKKLQDSKQNIQNMDRKIRMLQNRLQQLQLIPTNQEEIRREAKTKIKDVLQKMLDHQKDIQKAFKKYTDASIAADLDRLNLDSSRTQVAFLENKSKDIRKLCEEAEETLSSIKEAYTNMMSEAKIALQKAKKLSKGFLPSDPGFEEFREMYEKLSDNIEELETDKDTFLSKIDCLNTADEGELNEFEERQKSIAKLQDSVESDTEEFERIGLEMEILQEEWLLPLRQLVEQIHGKFSAAFRQMGCDGEVDICTGSNEKDYAEYGLSIKVKYRHSEPLQELNSITQSGGERAVATAVYMLSLQEITPVPFRCVDEINQGMDPNNERRIFELLVDATSKADTSQYFLITPKLVPGLKYVPTMKIHIVHNGPFVPTQEKWNSQQNRRSFNILI